MTVTGEDLTAVMDLIQLDGLPYPAMPVEARVAVILAKYAMYGVIPVIVPSLIPDIPIPVDRIPAQKGTDLAYINQLAQEAGYVFYIDPGPLPGISTAYWGPQIKFGVPQPALNVNMDTWTNVESLSFRYQPQDSIAADRVHPGPDDARADPDSDPADHAAQSAARHRGAAAGEDRASWRTRRNCRPARR